MRTLFFLLILLPLEVWAQVDAPEIPRFTLKTNLVPLINIFKQGYAVAADFRLTPRISVDAGAGAVFNSSVFANEKGESYRGPRFRAGIKYHLIRSEKHVFHLGLEGKYQEINHKSIQQAFRQGQQYLEFLTIDRTINTWGLAARVGWQFYQGKNNRFFIEPFAGLGLLFHRVERPLPPDAELVRELENFSFEYGPGKVTTPDVLLGVHIGVALW